MLNIIHIRNPVSQLYYFFKFYLISVNIFWHALNVQLFLCNANMYVVEITVR